MKTTTSSPESPPRDFSADLRQLWRTRPVRAPYDGPIAGVCAGIGHRYGIDPVIVRVVFIAAALWGGAGIGFYALGWLLFRQLGDQVSLGESLFGRGHASGSKALAVVLIFVAFAAAPTLEGASATMLLGSGVLLSLAMIAGWYGLYRRTPEPTEQWVHWSTAAHTATTTFSPEEGQTDYHSETATPRTPPAWDPLGTAPFAWDLPDPGQPQPKSVKRPRSRLTPITLGLAIIAAAIAGAVAHFAHVEWLTTARISAIALAVVAAGLLIGACTRRGHGLLVVAGPLTGLVVLASLGAHFEPALVLDEENGGGRISIGSRADSDTGATSNSGAADQQVTVNEPEQLRSFTSGAGDIDLDFSAMTLDRNRDIDVDSAFGDITITLPADTDIAVTCSSVFGTIECPAGLDTGNDGRGGPILSLNVNTAFGEIEVTR